MKRLLLRAQPWIVALSGALAAYMQFRFPLVYPWPLVALLLLYVAAVGWYLFEYKRTIFESALQMLPSKLFLVALALSVLLAETVFARWLITILFLLVPLTSLELMYLALFETFRYPVNALSRLNISFIPAIAFLLAVSGNGFYVFLRISPIWNIAVFVLVTGTLYFITSHPTADAANRLRWSVLGALIGLQAGILSLLLPVPLVVHGAIAAIIVSAPIRIRRYAYQPTPSRRHAWIESATAAVLFLTILLVSPWA